MRKPGIVLVLVLAITMIAAMHSSTQAELRFGPWVYYAPYYFPPPEASPECWPVGALAPRYESPPPPPPPRHGEWRQFERQLSPRQTRTGKIRRISKGQALSAPSVVATTPERTGRTKAKPAPARKPQSSAGSVYQPQATRQPGVRPALAPTPPGSRQAQ